MIYYDDIYVSNPSLIQFYLYEYTVWFVPVANDTPTIEIRDIYTYIWIVKENNMINVMLN